MENQLHKLYQMKFKELSPILKDYNEQASRTNKATNPFLLKVPENYQDFKNKIMVFGQETNTWCKECGNRSVFSNNIEKSIEIYQNFYLDGGINKYRGPFWNEFKRIKRKVSRSEDAFFIWNNVNKIGRVGKGNVDKINKIQFQYFQVIREEISYLKPNILVFLTGNNYDFFIKKNIGNFADKKIADNLFELIFEGEFADIKAFKTFHPNSLYHKGINRQVIPVLINEIKNACI